MVASVAGALNSGDPFLPFLLEDDAGVARANEWAQGFARGMKLRSEDWVSLSEAAFPGRREFLRSAGAKSKAADLDHCPSCGAALDRVSESGVCGYCEAKVTGGEFDWVLSTIDQDDSYRG